MHAFILAGGRGVRLRPYTTRLPKPLVPIGDDYSILEIVLMQLAAQGFKSVTLSIGYLGHLIQAFVGDGSRWGLQVDYATEDHPLGTMGPVRQYLDDLPEHFLVMNGDILTDLAFDDVLRNHELSGVPLTIATYARNVRIDFGVLETVEGEVTGFSEKPTIDYKVSMGVYGMSRSTLEHYRPGEAFGFDDLVHDLLDSGELPGSYDFNGFWLDVGRPEDYDRANNEFNELAPLLLPRLRAVTCVA
jgi:NDP-mannose synthase